MIRMYLPGSLYSYDLPRALVIVGHGLLDRGTTLWALLVLKAAHI